MAPVNSGFDRFCAALPTTRPSTSTLRTIDANNAGDANALGRDVVQVGDEQDASRHDFERLRRALGLPPPPGATAQPEATLPAV